MMNKKQLIVAFVFVIMLGMFLPMTNVDGITLMDNVNDRCKKVGDCTLCDVMMVIYNVGRFIFISIAGVSLILLLWAGIGLIMNWGNAESIAANKKIIFHTFLAIVIILAAWTLVNLLIKFYFKVDAGFWFDKEHWYRGPTSDKCR
jgi:hypothetical protein